jgi:hypothetical protein
MWATWWTLPGPSAFIDEILASLRAGRNLIVAMPEHAPPELGEAVGRRVHVDEIWRWRRLSPSGTEQGRGGPVRFLFDQLALAPPSLPGPWAERLAEATEMRDRILWIEGVSDATWVEWKQCLSGYAMACQSRPQFGRGLLCCVVSGISPEHLTSSDVALTVHRWTGRIDELDMQIWIAHLLRNAELPALERRARRVLAATLAGFDPILALRLTPLDLDALTNPVAVLEELAAERGWTQFDLNELNWERGMTDCVGGQRETHLALQSLAQEDARRYINGRVWQGQVTVVFPLLEQKRNQLLSAHKRLLWVPFEKGDGTFVTAIEDLEIAHLHYQLRNHPDHRIESLLRRLKDSRNALAHLDTLSGFDLAELLRMLSG